jgi:hypothetical protein
MNRQAPPTFKPCLEVLEERSTPSLLHAPFGHLQSPGTPAISASSRLDLHQVPLVPHAGTTFVKHRGHGVHAIRHLDDRNGDDRVVPFKVTGGGPAPDGLPLIPGETAPHSATGTASHLGAYTGSGTFVLGSLQISSTGAVSGTFQGSFVFVAANGDQLAFNYGSGFSGTFTAQLSADGTTVTNVTFVAVFTPDPANCTGRFAKVVGGGFTMIANVASVSLASTVPGFTPPFNYTWNGAGTLEFSK